MPLEHNIRQIGVLKGLFVFDGQNIFSGAITKTVVISPEQAKQYLSFKAGEEALIAKVPSDNFSNDNSLLIFKKHCVFDSYDKADASMARRLRSRTAANTRQRRGYELGAYDVELGIAPIIF